MSAIDHGNARDAAVKSDMHAEFATLRADIATLPTTWTLVATVLAFGGARFSAGISLADQRQEQLARDVRQDETAYRTEAKLDAILQRLPPR